jgi:3-hydroxyacyl-CoA dehydrogenase
MFAPMIPMIRHLTALPKASLLSNSSLSSRSFSTVKEIKKVGIVGLGLMGHGVAQVSAQAGYEIVGIESNSNALTVGSQRIESSLKKMIAKDLKNKKITEEEGNQTFGETMERIRFTTDIADAYDCDLIIEAIVENMDVKLKFYKDLANQIKPDAIFASNTSSLQITNMALASGRPQNFVGLHFFNPGQKYSSFSSSFSFSFCCCPHSPPIPSSSSSSSSQCR